MSYPIYYATCTTAVPDHLVDACGEQELGRVRSVAYVRSTYLDALLVDPTDAALWETGILNKDIIIIPATQGSYDGGTPVEVPGYGSQEVALAGYRHVINYKDPDFKLNAEFYNGIKQTREWYIAINTSTQTMLFSQGVATIFPKAPVQDDLNSEVVWDVEVRVSQPDIPVPFDTPPNIFEAFNYV